jgi:hypothetical protein
MDIVRVLKQEEAELQKRLTAVRLAIDALNSSHKRPTAEPQKRRKMSAAARARISQATKARWKKFRAAQAKSAAKAEPDT